MILIYDTETTGLTDDRLPAEHPNQPNLVQLGAILYTDVGSEVASVDLVVRPNGFTIPEPAARVHGITSGIANAIGVPLATVLSAFAQLRANAEEIVAFNLKYDDLIMRTAFARLGKEPSHPGPNKKTCAMELSKPILQLPPSPRMVKAGMNGFKPPSLMEAHEFFFKEKFENAHSALADCRAAARIFFEIRRREKEQVA